MATIDGIGLAEPSTITKSLAAVSITRNSSVTFQEVMVIGDPDSTTSSALAKVINSAPASTAWGLVTRPIGPLVVAQSTAGDLNVTVAGYSTTVNVSSLGGAVTIRSSAANALVTVYQSTASDFVANVSSVSGRVALAGFHAGDGVINVTDSTNNAINVNVVAGAAAGSTLATVRQSTFTDLNANVRLSDRDASTATVAVLGSRPASTSYGLAVRTVYPTYLSVAQSTVGQTTATVLISSAATTPHISAYSVVSTAAGPIVGGFFAGSTLVWPVLLWADGGVPSAHMAVAQPSYLFKGAADRPLNFHITSGSTAIIFVGLTGWQE